MTEERYPEPIRIGLDSFRPIVAGGLLPPVGTRLTLESSVTPGREWSQLVGFKESAYVLVQAPSKGVPAAWRGPVSDLGMLTVRYLYAGEVKGFRSRIISTISAFVHLLVLSYPTELRTHALREHARLACRMPCVMWFGGSDMRRAVLRDVSEYGYQARVALADIGVPDPVAEVSTVDLEVEIPGSKGRGIRSHRFGGQIVGFHVEHGHALVRVKTHHSLEPVLEHVTAFTAAF